MSLDVWFRDDISTRLRGLALTTALLPAGPERRGFVLGLAAVAESLGLQAETSKLLALAQPDRVIEGGNSR
ncbi:MAG: hypothetical protein ACYTEQ_19160 [Planctomycetota bacterium]|jgi:hypothetical protein